MKNLLFLSMFLLSGICCSQTEIPLALRMDLVTWVKLEPKSYLADGKIGTLEIKVRNYDVYQTASGQYNVNYTNSRGTISRKYLGYKFGGIQEYEGNTIFFNADKSKSWIWTVDRYGQLFKMDFPIIYSTIPKDLVK